MRIALFTKRCSLRDLTNEQASGRGVLRIAKDASLLADRALAKAGLRLLCPDATSEQALADLRKAYPKAQAFTRSAYLGARAKLVKSVSPAGSGLRRDVLDLFLVVLCEAIESGHPVYLVVDDQDLPGMLAHAEMLDDLYARVQGHPARLPARLTVMLVPFSSLLSESSIPLSRH
ncbi:hypothetical protein EPO34_04630 [Patescibacteria group bacterium]|nr:MAG: hypothetical protein EPO34_04630 [Patescibacteria group bacterium]